MSTLVLEIPRELVESLRIPPAEQQERLKHELSIRLYQKGILSFGKARQLAGMDKWEFHFLLGSEGITRSYDVEELEQDLETLESLP